MKEVKEYIGEYLKKIDYVTWDRYVIYGDDNATFCLFYGWIEREKDNYKDFALIEFNLKKKEISLVITSSAKYTNKFNKDTEGLQIDHNHCQRVEDDYPDLPNVVRLHKK